MTRRRAPTSASPRRRRRPLRGRRRARPRSSTATSSSASSRSTAWRAARSPRASLVVSVLSNGGLAAAVERAGGRVVRTPGRRQVHPRRDARVRAPALGGEKSGHVIVREHATSGDGIVTALEVLAILARTGRPLSELAAQIPLYPAAAADRCRVATRTVGGGPASRRGGRAAPRRSSAGRGRVLVRAVGHGAGAADHGRGRRRRRASRARRRAGGARRRAPKLARPARSDWRRRDRSHVRNRRLHRAARGGAHPARRPGAPRVPRLRLGRHRARHRRAASCSSRSAPASWPTCAPRCSTPRRRRRSGLAHTRWATHGRPNDLNAHPHVDCTGEITVIHNGIIENFKELRDGLDARGHRLDSETDTEALAHLVEEAYDGRHRRGRARRAAPGARRLRARGPPSRASRTGSSGARMNVPLIVGLGDGENFLASDVAAVLAHTRRVIFLEEGDVADLDRRSVRVTGHRRRAARAARPRDRLVDRGGREGRLRALHAQGDARAARGASAPRSPAGSTTTRSELDELEPVADASPRVERVELVACGSAAYASAVARHAAPGLGRACRRAGTSAPSSATARRRSTSARWSSRSPSRARRPTRIAPDAPGARSAAARSSRSPTPSARRSPARRTRCCSSRRAPRSRSWPPRRSSPR